MSLQDIASLTSSEKTALMHSVAQQMSNTFVAISEAIQRHLLTPENTAPLHGVIETVNGHGENRIRKLERSLVRYRRRAKGAKRWRAERRAILEDIEGLVRQIKELQQAWKKRVEAMEDRASVQGSTSSSAATSVSRSQSGSESDLSNQLEWEMEQTVANVPEHDSSS
ncbi:hypothetical protein BJX99DRAFT_262581 [Aspergillus californicus]